MPYSLTRPFIKHFLFICLLLSSTIVRAQSKSVTIVDSGQACSIRGMSIPDNHIIWLSGSNGHVARSTDAGNTWKWMLVNGYEKTDFRDIHAFDSNTAVIMGIGNPAYILKTRDGGQTWKLVYRKAQIGMFLDALDFLNDHEGICIGDPIEVEKGKRSFVVIRTNDGGDTWKGDPADRLPQAAEGEAIFSASGTNIALLNHKQYDYAFISGGTVSSLYLVRRSGQPTQVYPLPMIKGKESMGAFSMATDGKKKFYCGGGDYKAPDSLTGNLTWTTDNGRTWRTPTLEPPWGYRSCIRMISGKRLIACGTNGVDLCKDPNKWERISTEGFNVCMPSPNKKLIFLGGDKGKIGILKL
jgi:photosystem II stability/assembly factor-like uncharacterized protein